MAVALVLFFGYKMFFGAEGTGDVSLGFVPAGGAYESTLGQSILRTLSELRAIKLDTSIFENPIFLSLVGHEVSTTSIPLGRIDPFAPIDSRALSPELFLEE